MWGLENKQGLIDPLKKISRISGRVLKKHPARTEAHNNKMVRRY
jgi:signal recognition particle GTPase